MARVRIAAPPWPPGRPGGSVAKVALAVMIGLVCIALPAAYFSCLIEVPTNQQAVLISKVGKDLPPDAEIAPSDDKGTRYKGVQAEVLTEGRYFYNPVNWDWEIYDQFTVPQGKIGVRVALTGEELPTGQVLAEPGQKGILRDVLEPGRYSYNKYAQVIELHDPVTIVAGFRGVVTNLAGPIAAEPNALLVKKGERGVQEETLAAGIHYLNPYEVRVSLVDVRSQRYDLSEGDPMDFLSADGFLVVIAGNVEFRVIEDRIPEVFVLYNEDMNGDEIKDELISKVITPESRSICRISGSKLSGGAFLSGDDRDVFEQTLNEELRANCLRQGIEIVSVSISSIKPPQVIRNTIMTREVAKQKLTQFAQEKLQQESEAKLRVETLLADQKKRLIEAQQEVVEKTTRATSAQQVATTKAELGLSVAKTKLEAAKDQAKAITAKAEGDAEVIRFNNAAEVAGITTRVQAFQGDGAALAQNILVEKLAPAFRSIMSNTEGPIMELFSSMSKPSTNPAPTPLAARPAAEGSPTPEPAPAGEAPATLPDQPFANREEDKP